jgi:calcium-dependent protein kinase
MKKISEEEENEIYNVIKTALFSLCEAKPSDPVEYLARKMLQLVDDQSGNSAIRRDTILARKPTVDSDNFMIKVQKVNMDTITQPFLERYKILEKIHGDVYLAKDLKVPELIKAVKIIDKEKSDMYGISENTLDTIINLSHPNVIKIYEILEDEYHLYIVEEYCESGDLFNFILKNKIFSEDLVKVIIKQLLDALVYLHGKGIVHSNIHPENILIYGQYDSTNILDVVIKISDFATASLLSNKRNKSNNKLFSTQYYLAPEVIESNYDEFCDIWSVGAITYTLLCGKPPFDGKPFEVLFKILHDNYEFTPFQTEAAKSFISSLMNRNINKRINAKDALKHVWLEKDQILEKFDENVGVEILNKISNFVIGKSLRRSILSYIQSKKYYTEKNIELLRLFKQIDQDGNGLLEVSEIYDKYGKFFPGTPKEAWSKVKLFVERVDINNNGVIEYSEFLTISSLISKEINDNMLKEVFDFYDTNGNGYIQASDLREIFEDTDVKDDYLQYLVDENDSNNDRKISFQEFYEIMTNPN